MHMQFNICMITLHFNHIYFDSILYCVHMHSYYIHVYAGSESTPYISYIMHIIIIMDNIIHRSPPYEYYYS